MSAEGLTKKRGRPKKAVAALADPGDAVLVDDAEAQVNPSPSKAAKKLSSTAATKSATTSTSNAERPIATSASTRTSKAKGASTTTTKRVSSKTAAPGADAAEPASKQAATPTATGGRKPTETSGSAKSSSSPSTLSLRPSPGLSQILRHTSTFVRASNELNTSVLNFVSWREAMAKQHRANPELHETPARSSKSGTSLPRTTPATKPATATPSSSPQAKATMPASPSASSSRSSAATPKRQSGPVDNLSRRIPSHKPTSSPPPPPEIPRPLKPTELPLRVLQKDPKYRSLSRRWTSFIIALPIAMVTSYFLFQRYLEQQKYLRNREQPVRTLEHSPSRAAEAAELQALRKSSGEKDVKSESA